MSAVAFADPVGASPAAVRFWASGYRNPADKKLAEVAKVLGVTVSFLRTGKEG